MRSSIFFFLWDQYYDYICNYIIISIIFSNIGILDKVMGEEPRHGMNWSPATKEKFTNTMNRKKDFTNVAKIMNKKKGDCQAYYYSSFKGTMEYLQMTRAPKPQSIRQVRTRRTSSNVASGECEKCQGDGELLCCDMCDNMFHLRCVTPPLEHVPSGNWFCNECDPNEE